MKSIKQGVKRKVKVFGRSIPVLAIVAIAMSAGLASAILLEYYGAIKTTVTVKQAVLLDGKDYTQITKETAEMAGGEFFLKQHWLESQTSVPVDLEFETTFSPTLTNDEIPVTYLKSTGFEETFTTVPSTGILPIDVTVEDIGDWIQWTFDYFVNADPDDVTGYLAYVASGDVDSKLAAMVAISYDEDEPAYLVHNNDGHTPGYDVGTWLYCPNLALLLDHDSNTPVEGLEWIDATTDFERGKIVVKILKEKLVDEAGATLHWAVYAGIRGGVSLPYTLSTYPANFDWVSFESATILKPIEQPFTLAAGERLDFYIKYEFDKALVGTYTITTTVEPVK